MKRIHLIIHGLVQGVFFRAETKQKADELAVTGWVANESDGTVTIVAEGPENKINELTLWCHSGPSKAKISKVHAVEEPYCAEFEGFEVRY
jgi:acylphosphatase